MGKSVNSTVCIRTETYEECKLLVDSGEFSTFSDLVNYSMRFHLYHILRDKIDTIEYLPGEEHVYQRVRLDGWYREGFISSGLLSKSDIVEYSLSYFLDHRRELRSKQPQAEEATSE